MEAAPADGYRWGFLKDAKSWMGSRPAGAFGNEMQMVSAWFGRAATFSLSDGWHADISGTLALGHANMPAGEMLDVDAHIMSPGKRAWNVAHHTPELEWPVATREGRIRGGTVHVHAGAATRQPFYQTTAADLAPDSREFQVTLTHEWALGHGLAVVEVAHSQNHLHVYGRTHSRLGAAWYMTMRKNNGARR